MPFLEIAAFNLPSAIRACTSGASRIELCSEPSVGGLTPSLNTLTDLKSSPEYHKAWSTSPHPPSSTTPPTPSPCRIPVYVMIRPHANSFTYSEQDIQTMESSISSFLIPEPDSDSGFGADGFVFGCLTPTGAIDVSACTRLLDAARGRPCTFHRAFDAIPGSRVEEDLEILIKLGFRAVLSSGGAARAVEGVEVLRKLASAAVGRIDVIVGGGVRGENLEGLRRGVGEAARWFHSSAIVNDGEVASETEVRKMSDMLNR